MAEKSKFEKERHKALTNPNYYEGILQLRDPTPELVDYAIDMILKDKQALVTKQKRIKNGWDWYFTSQKYLQQLGRKLKQAFPGELKISRKLHTQNKVTGKKVYRVTVLFKLLSFGRGTKLEMNGEQYEIIKIAKDRAQVKNTKTGKKEWYDIKKLKSFV